MRLLGQRNHYCDRASGGGERGWIEQNIAARDETIETSTRVDRTRILPTYFVLVY
jgi:hypothetical protein